MIGSGPADRSVRQGGVELTGLVGATPAGTGDLQELLDLVAPAVVFRNPAKLSHLDRQTALTR